MALLTCPECSGKVSSYASSCPHCGCPISVITETLIERREQGQESLEIEHKTMGHGTIVETGYGTIMIQFPNEEKPRKFIKKMVRDKLSFVSKAAEQQFWEHEDAADKEYELAHPVERVASKDEEPVLPSKRSSVSSSRWFHEPYEGIVPDDMEEVPDDMEEDDIDERMDDNFYIGDGDDWGE